MKVVNTTNNPLITDGFLRDYFLKKYQKYNEKQKKHLVYHLGNRGFYAEMTTVARAMLYCYANSLQLWLCSDDFGYRYKQGWEDYFLPFCKEYNATTNGVAADHCYSDRRGTGTLFNKVLGFTSDEISFGPITIKGMQEILRFFMLLIYRFTLEVEQKVNKQAALLNIPPDYNAIHVRRGDKVGCAEDMFYPAEVYLDHLFNKGVVRLPLFIMSDDFGAVKELEEILKGQGVSPSVITLCNDTHAGFDIFALRDRTLTYSRNEGNVKPTDSEYRQHIYAETIRLLTETIVAARSNLFIGTRKSNIGWMVRALHNQPECCVLIRPEQNVTNRVLRKEPLPQNMPVIREDSQLGKKVVTAEKGELVPDENIQPMEIAKIAGERICLFFDIFVHWSGNKITATSPYYGNDIEWVQFDIDLKNVVLTAGDISVTGEFIPHRLDSWEPAILFDFESPELRKMINKRKPLDITISAGPHQQTFTIDCCTAPRYPVAMSLMIRDENRWIRHFIDYYLLCLDVSHIFVYDNYTSDTDQLKKILLPYVRQGKVTYIPWHYQRRQRIDTKHIAQTVQESHTLNRYGETPWIGFLDIDEFLRIPGKTLPEFLEKYHPDKVDGLSFDVRWFMYKGESDFEAIENPLLSYFHSKPDALGRKRQKLMVSARHVRFIRLHWLEEGKKEEPVTDPDIFFHHYYLRRSRFERAQTEQCTGYDEYMLQFAAILKSDNTQQSYKVDLQRTHTESKARKGKASWIPPIVKMNGKIECDGNSESKKTAHRAVTFNHLPIEVVIFSKDRACQLDALLRSMDQFVKIEHRRNVLYTYSTNDFGHAYRKVSADYPGVNFFKEVSFKYDLLNILESAKHERRHILFLVDDIIFTRVYAGGENIEAFNSNENILTISLRLGENITYCQVRNINTVPHDFSQSNTWCWEKAHIGYWNYPMSVDGHIFRATDIVNLIESLDFSNPSTLEATLACNAINKPLMIAEQEPFMVNLALNHVQDVLINPSGDISADQLNRKYLNGEKIDIRPIINGKYTSCHITPKIEFL